MNNLQEKQLAFLEDTYEYYNEDVNRRSFAETENGAVTCLYKNKDAGTMCAIGRFLEDAYDPKMENKAVDDIFELLPDKLKELGKGFLWAVQSFHDDDCNWDSEGISKIGMKKYNQLLDLIKQVPL